MCIPTYLPAGQSKFRNCSALTKRKLISVFYSMDDLIGDLYRRYGYGNTNFKYNSKYADTIVGCPHAIDFQRHRGVVPASGDPVHSQKHQKGRTDHFCRDLVGYRALQSCHEKRVPADPSL